VYAQAYESFISFYNAYAYAKGEPPRIWPLDSARGDSF
jgi:hypothetical protein